MTLMVFLGIGSIQAFEAVEGRHLKLSEEHPHTIESMNNLIDLYEAWNKPEEAEKWQAKLLETEIQEQ
jgi:hypothetical protein